MVKKENYLEILTNSHVFSLLIGMPHSTCPDARAASASTVGWIPFIFGIHEFNAPRSLLGEHENSISKIWAFQKSPETNNDNFVQKSCNGLWITYP
jgi:hypothetical protein